MKKVMYTVTAHVIRGSQYGRVLGFPTANLDGEELIDPPVSIPEGVYSGYATIGTDSRKYRAGVVVTPLTKNKTPKIEAHLLDFTGDLYGQTLTIYCMEFIRPFVTFTDENLLRKQIGSDLERIRSTLSLVE